MDYREKYESWLSSQEVSEEDRASLKGMSEEEVYEAFYKTVQFGTGGMRGIMGLGTNRLNIYTIRMAAKAMAYMLPEKASVVVAYDSRNNSKEFAEETAKVMAAANVKAYLFGVPSPVPLLSFAIRHFGADGGVVITASHNTKEYNGFKAYDSTGCQMLPDKTELIAANMEAMEDPFAIETASLDNAIIDTGLIVPLGGDVIEEFQEAIKDCGGKDAPTDLKIVYTSLHGSGRDYVLEALRRAGFENVSLVKEQEDFNGDFPTVAKPNPEDPAALSIAAEQAIRENADIVIGTDPDCDRVGVGVVVRDEETGTAKVEYLTGNQTGVLLIDYLCCTCSQRRFKEAPRLITTIVTSEMGPAIARSYGVDVTYVLTGFKYIGDIMNHMVEEDKIDDFLMGYEESYGYLTAPHARDKDAVSSSLAICRMAAWHKSGGRDLIDVINKLYEAHGYYMDAQQSLVYEGSEGEETMKGIMADFREKKESIFEDTGETVSYEDFEEGKSGLPLADVLKYSFEDGSWVAVRPSGTEPKIKIYYCMRGKDQEEAKARKDAAASCISKLTGADR